MKKKRASIRVIYPTREVVCQWCGWKGRRTELNMLKPCPNCKRRLYSKHSWMVD